MKSLVAVLSISAAAPAFAREAGNSGGETLRRLVEECSIVGIASTNGGARYALRNFQAADVVEVGKNSIVIQNIPNGVATSFRPRFIRLNLLARRGSGAAEEYLISAELKSGDKDPFVIEGSLAPIWFSTADRIEVSANNEYGYRGQGVFTFASREDLANGTDGFSEPRTLKWDLALPSTFSKDALCRSGNDVFVR